MKDIGIIRRIDELGRVVIPKEIRENLEIKQGTPMEFYIEEEKIILQKHNEKECTCGKRIDKEDKFCRFCGKVIERWNK